MRRAVARDVVDRDDGEVVPPRELEDLRKAGHRAVGVREFAEHSRGSEPGETHDVHGGLGMPAAFEDESFRFYDTVLRGTPQPEPKH